MGLAGDQVGFTVVVPAADGTSRFLEESGQQDVMMGGSGDQAPVI